MKVLVGVLVAAGAVTLGQMGNKQVMHDASAKTYEHLATVIIETRHTEESLVQGILRHYHALAQRELAAAVEADGGQKAQHMEMAAEEIANIANEGDKQVQAVRQRLLKAGHHHRTDKQTREDYIFIDSAEKKELLTLASHVGKIAGSGSEADVKKAAGSLASLFEGALKPE